jgi:hypothetical protein
MGEHLELSYSDDDIVSVRMKQNSATVCNMGSRTKREGHRVNPRFEVQGEGGIFG